MVRLFSRQPNAAARKEYISRSCAALGIEVCILLSLASACGHSGDSATDENNVVEIPDGVTPSPTGLTILRNQWVIEHGNDEYTLIDLPEELRDASEREVVMRNKNGEWDHYPLTPDDADVSLSIENLPKGEKWLTVPGIEEGAAKIFEEVGPRIIDAREHIAAKPGVSFNENFLAQPSSKFATKIAFDRSYPFVALSCPDVGEVRDSAFARTLYPDNEDPNKISFGPSRLVNGDGSRGRCKLAFGTGNSSASGSLVNLVYYADYVISGLEIDGDFEVSPQMADDDLERMDLKLDWEWDDARKILAHGDLEPSRAEGYATFERLERSESGYLLPRETIAHAQITSRTGPAEMPDSTVFSIPDDEGPGEIHGWAIRQIFYRRAGDHENSEVLMAAAFGPAVFDRESGTYRSPLHAPPLGVRLNGVDLLTPEHLGRREIEADDEIEILLRPDAKDVPTQFEVDVMVRPPNEPDDFGSGFTIVSTQPKFVLPPLPQAEASQRGAMFVTLVRARYCDKPENPDSGRTCPSAVIRLETL
jgi:hypothetical protein